MVEYLFATEEQKELAMLMRTVLEDHLVPQLEELQHADDGRGKFPMDVMNKLAEVGFCGMNVPEEYGGLGLDLITQAIIVEEMTKVDCSFTFAAYNIPNLVPQIMMSKLPEEEKTSWLTRTANGEAYGGLALTEPGAGSDAAAIRTTAVKDGNEWVLNGTKCFCSNGSFVDFILIPAWTDKSKSAGKGVTLFFVEKERGYKLGKKEKKMGMKLSETMEIILEDVRVPEDHIVGEIGEGFKACMAFLSESRIFDAVLALGLAQAALDTAVEYAKTRRQFGKRIIDHQGLGFLIADMQARTYACRAMVYDALRAVENGTCTKALSSAVKMYVTDCTMQTTTDAVQVLGGYGYMADYPVEKYMRDAKIFQIFGGTNQIQRDIIARALAGKDPEAKQ